MMRNFKTWLHKQLDELDVLESIYLELDDPGDTIEWLVRQAADRACRLGLADVYKQSLGIKRGCLATARWYFSQCLAATHGPRQELPDGDTFPLTDAMQTRQVVQPNQPLTVPEVAKYLRVRPDKVLSWIRSGRLFGYNTSEHDSGRPKYRVNPDDLKAFMQQRGVNKPTPAGRPKGSRSTRKKVLSWSPPDTAKREPH